MVQVLDRMCGAPHLSEILCVPSTADSAVHAEEGVMAEPLLRVAFAVHKVRRFDGLWAGAALTLAVSHTGQPPLAWERGSCTDTQCRMCRCTMRLLPSRARQGITPVGTPSRAWRPSCIRPWSMPGAPSNAGRGAGCAAALAS